MHLAEIVSTHAAVTATRSRKAKVAHLARCLGRLAPDEIRIGVGYLSGELPQGRIGLGPSMVLQMQVPAVIDPVLSLQDVNSAFDGLATILGKGAKAARVQQLSALLGRATVEEQLFLKNLLLGELRQGALEGLMIESLAQATGISTDQIRRAVMLSGRPADVAECALRDGPAGLAAIRLTMFQPLQAMLAQPASGTVDALQRLGEAALEFKLDGARIQVHRVDEQVRVYTRQLHDVTERVPEVVDAVLALPCRRLLLDGEAIALSGDGRPLPFQVTMQRFGRRRDVDEVRRRIPLSARFFDCLLIDDDELIDADGAGRDDALRSLLPGDLCVERLVTSESDGATAFLRRAIAAGHEGIMAKSLTAPYQAGSRGTEWLKIKPTHTLDLVVLAAEWGSGRRAGTLSNLHLGARADHDQGFVMLGKTFKGLTDRTLAWQTKALLDREVARDGNVVHVRPELVVEVAFNELQRSPQYPAGLALRFARIKRYRDDKAATQADTMATVHQIYQQGFAAPTT
jgi:DNA ligase-1